MTAINLSRVHFPVTTLGPGQRVGVWFQGCSIRCPGCLSLDTWAPGRGSTTVAAVFDAIAPHLHEADGLTVSGGEPFDQPEALRVLLEGWRASHNGDVLVYSGQSLEALHAALPALEGLVDAIVADPFDAGAGDGLALRGSDNQRLVPLSDLGSLRFGPLVAAAAGGRTLDVSFDEGCGAAFLAGIPRRGDLDRLRALLATAGHAVSTTQDPREAR